MPDRYYSAQAIEGNSVTLDGNEAHHLLHVMRAQPGLELIVFDGQGGEFAAEVVDCKRATVELTVGNRQDTERELPFELNLAVALPKGDRQRWLIEKAVEMGVTRLVPLQTARSVGKSDPSAKLARYVIEASKQCGRNRLMEITPTQSWANLAGEVATERRLLAHPGGQPLAALDSTSQLNDITLAIGPEGGFTEDEASQAVAAGWQSVGLGDRILRIETAAIALAAAFALGTHDR